MCSKNMWSKDRRPNKHLIVGLTISTAIAVVVLVVTTASQAAQLNSFSVGPRAQRFNNNIDKVVTDDGKVKGKGKGSRTKVSTTDQGDGRPGHRPPKKP